MRTSILIALAVAACSTEADTASPMASNLAGISTPIPFLANTAVFGGVENEMLVLTEPGAPAALYVSARSTGTTCPSLLRPVCLSMAKALFLGQGTADGTGKLTITGNAPSGYPGSTVHFQVASILSTGGALSSVISLPYYDTCQAPSGVSLSGDGVLVTEPLEVFFADPVAEYAEYTLNGAPLSGTVAAFSANFGANLEYDTTYTLSVKDPCGNAYDYSFATEAEPLTFGESLVGRGWALDLTNATIAPASLNTYKAQLLGALTDPLVVGVYASDDVNDELDVSLGYGVAGGTISQNLCEATTEFPGADFSAEPTVSATVAIPEFADLLDLAEIDATFSGDGTALGDVELRAWITAQAAAELAGLTGFDDNTVCALLPIFVSGVSCINCPVSAPAKCISATITGIVGTEIDGAFVTRSAGEIAADPSCVP